MRHSLVPALFLALTLPLQAVDYPRAGGFVNDYTGNLDISVIGPLEQKLRGFEKATSTEVAVAIVPSLQGQSVDEYARGLFHEWGIGKRAANNGVLFVWAPTERKVRIEVGTGLTNRITDSDAARILQPVTTAFRNNQYADGVNAAVDGILNALGGNPGGAAAPADESTATSPPLPEQEHDSSATFFIAIAVAFGLGGGLYLLYRRTHTAHLRDEVPQLLSESEEALTAADRARAPAQAALDDLRREAPPEVWQPYEEVLSSAPGDIARSRSELAALRNASTQSYAELNAVTHDVRRWRKHLRDKVGAISDVAGRLDAFRAGRTESQALLGSVPASIARMEAQGVPGWAEGLLQAASDTYKQAVEASRQNPANWLMVRDLLADAAACLDRIENPTRNRYRPVRYWQQDFDTPANLAMLLLYDQMNSQPARGGGIDIPGVGDSGSSFGGSDFGGFGGGDSGGGGASSGY
jgi:uncharacterized membrane protein YgcG